MPKEKWLIDPSELDEFQREILNIGLDKSCVIKGCAGSGKTVLAIHRVNDIRLQALAEDPTATPSFTMVVYTNSLREFIRCGVKQLEINLKQIVLYERWDGSEVDYIIVDEVQDFAKDEIDMFSSAARKSMMLYGDSQQQVYRGLKQGRGQEMLTIEQIADYLKLPMKELRVNHRLPKEVASFASHLCSDSDLENRCRKVGMQKPIVHTFKNWMAELDYIMKEINTRNYSDVAILLPFNLTNVAPSNNGHRNVQSVREYFNKRNFSHECKWTSDENSSNELDFDSDLPKIMNFHSSKGLQFETIFIPFCDYPNHDRWFREKYSNPFYVGVTRTCRNLYITHSERISPFLKGIPTHKYIAKSSV